MRALSKVMDRLATMSSSEAEPGIKEMFINELVEDDAIDQFDKKMEPTIPELIKFQKKSTCVLKSFQTIYPTSSLELISTLLAKIVP